MKTVSYIALTIVAFVCTFSSANSNGDEKGNVTGKYVFLQDGKDYFELTFHGDALVGGAEIHAGVGDQTVPSGVYKAVISVNGNSSILTLVGEHASITIGSEELQTEDTSESNGVEIKDSAQGKKKVTLYYNGTAVSFFIY